MRTAGMADRRRRANEQKRRKQNERALVHWTKITMQTDSLGGMNGKPDPMVKAVAEIAAAATEQLKDRLGADAADEIMNQALDEDICGQFENVRQKWG
jgi:hypothetical protein